MTSRHPTSFQDQQQDHITLTSPQGLVRRELQDNQQTWIQLGADIDGRDAYGHLGDKVALSSDGTVLAAGGPTSGSYSGYVRVFKYASNTWTQLGSDINGADGDYFGSSVSLSSDGTVLAVGGALSNGKNGVSSGRVRVYKYANSEWTQRGADINGEAASDYSGCSVHLSSDGMT